MLHSKVYFLVKRLDQESTKSSRTSVNHNEKEQVIPTHPASNRRSTRQLQSEERTPSIDDPSRTSVQEEEEEEEESIQDQSSQYLSSIIEPKKHSIRSLGSDLVPPARLVSSKNKFLIPFCIIT